MESVSSKIFEIFRSLKSDAVPKPPRQTDAEPDQPRGPRSEPAPETNGNPSNNKDSGDESEHEEIIFNEDDFLKDESEKGQKKEFKSPFHSFFKSKSEPNDPKKPSTSSKQGSFSSVNTQATGPVFNIINASGVQVGSNHVYYMSAVNGKTKTSKPEKTESNEHIEKDNLIMCLMESTIPPTHKYIYYVANNLGSNWQSFYIILGYSKGKIETWVEEKGIIEARYKLLHEWAENNDNGTLGRLATLLWEEGERQIVRELSLIYKENKK